MRRAPQLALLVAGVAAVAGCAALIEINDLSPPAGGAATDAGDAGAGDPCSTPGLTNLTVTPRALHIALDDTDVYFAKGDPPSDSAILRCSKCGCTEPTVLVSKQYQPGAIAVDADYVFFTDTQEAGSLTRFSKKDPSDRKQIAPLESPIGVAVDADYVYWTVIGGGPLGVASAGVFRAKKDLTEVTRLAKAAELPDDIVPYAIAVDDTHVYYTTAPDLVENSQEPCNADYGTIRRVPKTGGLHTSEKLATRQPCPLAIAIDSDAVFWTTLAVGSALGGSVRTSPKAGGQERKLADGQGRPTSVAIHRGRLTWNVPGSQRIVSCTMPECADPTTLASAQGNPSAVRADDTGIYWSTFGTTPLNFTDGALRRVSPP